MRKLVLSLSLLFTTTFAFAQIGINTTGAAPATSAMLDVSSNSKGFLPPRMTTAQRLAISSPVKGLVAYDTDEDELYLYKGTGDIWYKLSSINAPLVLTSPTTTITGITTNSTSSNYAVLGYAPNGGTAIKGSATTGSAIDAGNNTDLSPAGYFHNPSGTAIWAFSVTGSAIFGESRSTGATGLFFNTGGGTSIYGYAIGAGVGGIMESVGTGNSLNAKANAGKAIDATNNSATNATGRFQNAGSGFGVQSLSISGTALYGLSGTSNGLYAETNGGTAAAARIVNNNGTGNAIDATNNSATNATGRFGNSGNYHAIQAISYGSSATGRFVNNSTGYGIHATANDVLAYAGYFNNIAGNGVFISAGAGTGATITSAGKAIEAYGGGIENSIVATNTSATKATIKLRNDDANGAAVELQGQISIPSSATNRAIFQHTTAVGNITGNYTTLSYPNALATDFLMVTQIFGSVGNPYVVAVDYFGGAWVIYNVNGASMLANAKYNVLVIRQ